MQAGAIEEVSSAALKPGDRVVVEAGQTIPGDGEIIEGIASVDESAITGESAPVIRAAGRRPVRVSPGARSCSPTGSWSRSPAAPANRSWTG